MSGLDVNTSGTGVDCLGSKLNMFGIFGRVESNAGLGVIPGLLVSLIVISGVIIGVFLEDTCGLNVVKLDISCSGDGFSSCVVEIFVVIGLDVKTGDLNVEYSVVSGLPVGDEGLSVKTSGLLGNSDGPGVTGDFGVSLLISKSWSVIFDKGSVVLEVVNDE